MVRSEETCTCAACLGTLRPGDLVPPHGVVRSVRPARVAGLPASLAEARLPSSLAGAGTNADAPCEWVNPLGPVLAAGGVEQLVAMLRSASGSTSAISVLTPNAVGVLPLSRAPRYPTRNLNRPLRLGIQRVVLVRVSQFGASAPSGPSGPGGPGGPPWTQAWPDPAYALDVIKALRALARANASQTVYELDVDVHPETVCFDVAISRAPHKNVTAKLLEVVANFGSYRRQLPMLLPLEEYDHVVLFQLDQNAGPTGSQPGQLGRFTIYPNYARYANGRTPGSLEASPDQVAAAIFHEFGHAYNCAHGCTREVFRRTLFSLIVYWRDNEPESSQGISIGVVSEDQVGVAKQLVQRQQGFALSSSCGLLPTRGYMPAWQAFLRPGETFDDEMEVAPAGVATGPLPPPLYASVKFLGFMTWTSVGGVPGPAYAQVEVTVHPGGFGSSVSPILDIAENTLDRRGVVFSSDTLHVAVDAADSRGNPDEEPWRGIDRVVATMVTGSETNKRELRSRYTGRPFTRVIQQPDVVWTIPVSDLEDPKFPGAPVQALVNLTATAYAADMGGERQVSAAHQFYVDQTR